MKRMRGILVLLALVALATSASAGTYFSTTFDGPGLDANLIDSDSAYTINGTAVVSSVDGADRHYIRTVDTDYNTKDWTYEVTYNAPASGEYGNVFMGLGDASPDSAFYNEPSNSLMMATIYLSWHGKGMFVQRHIAEQTSDTTYQDFPRYGEGGSHRAIITKSGDSLVFALDLWDDGSVDYTADALSISTEAPFLDNTNSRLFFGTAEESISFDSMIVTPEPATLALLGCGSLLIGLRRRK